MALWPRRSRGRSPTNGGGTAIADPPVEACRRPCLQGLVASARTGGVRRVLDLGPAMPGNLSLYQTFAEHVCFADLFRTPDGASAQSVATPGPDLLGNLLPALSATFDLIVAWDALDHLDPAATRLLVDRLVSCSHPGTRLYATASMSPTVPARQPRFEILDDGERVAANPRTGESRPGPMLTPAEVAKRLAPFQTARAVVLTGGIREVVTVLPSEPAAVVS